MRLDRKGGELNYRRWEFSKIRYLNIPFRYRENDGPTEVKYHHRERLTPMSL